MHPRVGAADVVPLVPIRPDAMPRAQAAALTVAERIAEELGLPVFLYGASAPAGRGPAFFRRGGPEELQRRVDAGELAPDFGPARLHETAGAVLVGARKPLIAFNVNLRGGSSRRGARRSPRSSARRAAASRACARSASSSPRRATPRSA